MTTALPTSATSSDLLEFWDDEVGTPSGATSLTCPQFRLLPEIFGTRPDGISGPPRDAYHAYQLSPWLMEVVHYDAAHARYDEAEDDPRVVLEQDSDLLTSKDAYVDSSPWLGEAISRLIQASEDAGAEDWDGEGAARVQQASVHYAARVLNLLACDPFFPEVPEVSVDPDGEIALSWQRVSRLVFSISVGPNGALSYAGLFGPNETYGTEVLGGTLPKAIAANLARLLSADPTTDAD